MKFGFGQGVLRHFGHGKPMAEILPLAKFTNPLGGQVIELQQLDYESGGMSLLRLRIREKSRFTIFEIDPQTAQQWAEAMIEWARTQPAVTKSDCIPPVQEGFPGSVTPDSGEVA